MQKLLLIIGSSLGAISVAIGAFGAHALKSTLEANQRIDTFETATKYQFYHTLALILIALLMDRLDEKLLTYAGWSMIVGIVFFSGSLYILSIGNITKFGAVAPVGGLAFIIGWVLLLTAALKA